MAAPATEMDAAKMIKDGAVIEEVVEEEEESKKIPEITKHINIKPEVQKKESTVTNVILTEDSFGILYDDMGNPRSIKRFTWKNQNKIEVSIITYGARITCMKLPDKKGNIADIVMGFSDLAGYLYYGSHCFGATIGRVTNYIENATFQINGKQYWLTPNESPHHFNGGTTGLDKVVWNHYIEGTKVILTYLSPDKEEGYPGDLLVKITYELTPKNEFSINMEATTTKTTIVNLSNMTYLNLAGHNAGPEEMYKHMLTVNANCYTVMDERGFPKGEIQNVSYTQFDFQVPQVLTNVMGINDKDGYNQNLCVNRGVYQDNAFIARLLHVPSGRMVELYSNQCGVNVYSADRLGTGEVKIAGTEDTTQLRSVGSPFDLVLKLHNKIKDTLEIDKEKDYLELRNLIRKLQKCSAGEEEIEEEAVQAEGEEECPDLTTLKLTPIQWKYLDQMRGISKKVESVTDYTEVRDVINRILKTTIQTEDLKDIDTVLEGARNSISKRASASSKGSHGSKAPKNLIEDKKKELLMEMKRKGMIIPENTIPSYYKDGKVHGKSGCIYKKHGALVLQTQNYPNAIYHKNFPNPILNPSETYKHTIVYKFYRQAGNPNRWIKQYRHQMKKRCVNVVKHSYSEN